MKLTPREQELLNLIRQAPQSTPEALARRLGTTRSAVNVHVSSLIRKGALLGRGYLLPAPGAQRVVVVGGANMDFKAQTHGAALPATSNPGTLSQSPGGVGRNLAENLARLGVATGLLSAVGRDVLGDLLLSETEKVGVDVREVLRVPGVNTGTYTAILGAGGELVISVADMAVMDSLTPGALAERRAYLSGAAWLVLDGNLSPESLSYLLTLAPQLGAKVAFEPVSVAKAERLRPALAAGLAPDLITPNLDELAALTGERVADDDASIEAAAETLRERGVGTVWVSRGAQGSLLCTPEGTTALPALSADLVDVTGAGDSMLAAYLAALLRDFAPADAAAFAHAAAALTVESPLTVVPDLSFERVTARLNPASPKENL